MMSLRLRLVATLGITLVLLWGVTAAWSMRDLSTRLEHSLDQRLAQSAHMVAGLLERMPGQVWRSETDDMSTIPALEGIACRVSSVRGQVVADTHPGMDDVLAVQSEGYSYREHDGQRWRAYTLVDDGKRITVADRLREREALLLQVRNAALYPFVFALVGSLIALWWGVTRELSPLTWLQRRLVSRDPGDLSELPCAGLPSEIRPLIDGFNTLLGRTRRVLELEQRFTDDAAHELRTPLTAIRTHLQISQRVEGQQRRDALQQAEDGVTRLSKTLDQLLLLARMESAEEPQDDLHGACFDAALEMAMAETESRDVCRVNRAADSLAVALTGTLLTTVLRNLLENAQHHGEPGAPIDIQARACDRDAIIEVTSRGERIPPERLARLTERFRRGHHPRGSGLGLSIVEAIVTRVGGSLALESGDGDDVGMRVRLRLPLA
ncbi:ATP-binding protein [Halomonas borealis]|uniref:ATP-binding protein n=1 Tax=Halomonas borealis TaxID=2508710 RepID=UPI0010A088DA|nr:ATP-binding protein [Halomonas borealis]